MKIFGKTEEKAIDSLLRAQRSNFTGSACQAFDADRANAYVEQMLTLTERQRYENHIAACGQCRRLTVALMRAVQADPASSRAATITSVEKSSKGWITALRGFVPALATPRFALVATAIVALAIAVPFILSSQNKGRDSVAQSSASAAAPSAPASDMIAKQSEAAPASPQIAQEAMETHRQNEVGETAATGSTAKESKDSEHRESEIAAGLLAQAGDTNKTSPAEEVAPAPPPAPSDNFAKKESEPAAAQAKTDESARRTERAQSQPEPVATEAEKPLPKINRDDARNLPEADKNSQPKVVELAPGKPGVEVVGDKDKPVIRPESNSRPRPESHTEGMVKRRIADGPSSSSDSGSGGVKPPVRSTRETKVQGKRFFFQEGIWTDKDYKKDKEMPVVPVEQGSALYDELMAKHSKLKLYFASFVDQSAIIVYKGTVYKLTPKK